MLGIVWPKLPTDPLVLFVDTEVGYKDFAAPQKVLELQWSAHDLSYILYGMVDLQGEPVRVILQATMVFKTLKLSQLSCGDVICNMD